MADTQNNNNTLQNWHGDNTPMTPGQNGQPDLIAMLSNFFQNGSNPSPNNSAGWSMIPQQQPQLPPAHQAAIDGAIQGIKKAASEASTAGGLDVANHIIDLATSGVGFNTPNPQALDMGSSQAPTQPQTPAQPQAKPPNLQGAGNPLGDFMNMLGINATPANQVLGTEAQLNRQKLQAGNPAEVALPQAQAAAIQQKIAGQEPLQASDYASIVGSMNSLSLDALKTASQRMADDLKDRQAEIDTSQKTINMMGRLGGMFSGTGTTVTAATQKAQDEIKRLKMAKSTVDAQIATFKPKNPVTNKIDMEAPPGAAHYSPSTGKYYDAKGNEIK